MAVPETATNDDDPSSKIIKQDFSSSFSTFYALLQQHSLVAVSWTAMEWCYKV